MITFEFEPDEGDTYVGAIWFRLDKLRSSRFRANYSPDVSWTKAQENGVTAREMVEQYLTKMGAVSNSRARSIHDAFRARLSGELGFRQLSPSPDDDRWWESVWVLATIGH